MARTMLKGAHNTHKTKVTTAKSKDPACVETIESAKAANETLSSYFSEKHNEC